MSQPVLAIVGRPNVGKSRLFNRLIGARQALVHDQPGVTRDRLYGKMEWNGVSLTLIDTGGLIPKSEHHLDKEIWKQSFHAIEEADVVLCLLDGKEGLQAIDQTLIHELRKIKKSVFYAVNKMDHAGEEGNLLDFARAGISPIYDISAEHGRKIGDLLDAIVKSVSIQGGERSPPTTCGDDKEEFSGDDRGEIASESATPCNDSRIPVIALIGRPNVGKSSLINRLAGEERVIVYEQPGTTRDAIDVKIERGRDVCWFIDTAGIKRKKQNEDDVGYWSILRSMQAIERANIVCILIDGLQGLTHQDVQLAFTAWEQHKPVLLIINKWDLVKNTWKEYQEWCDDRLGALAGIPLLHVSALSGQNCDKIWRELRYIHRSIHKQVGTAPLNRWLQRLQETHPPAAYQGKPVKFFYATQTEGVPPHFILFTNQPKGVKKEYLQYMKHQLLELLGVSKIPVVLTLKEKS